MGIYSDAMIDSLKQVSSVIHEHGSCVAVQLSHAGKNGIGKDEYSPMGPSDVIVDGVKKASAMTVNEIERTVSAFGDAAERAVKSGFDAVQIHAAHGYLLSQFLSGHYNLRDDAYGGSLENRANSFPPEPAHQSLKSGKHTTGRLPKNSRRT